MNMKSWRRLSRISCHLRGNAGGSEFDFEICRKTVLDQFKKENLTTWGWRGRLRRFSALGALLNYLKDTQRKVPLKINRIRKPHPGSSGVDLTPGGIWNCWKPCGTRKREAPFLWVLDQTKTAMGKRLYAPGSSSRLLSCGKIIRRQNAVEELYCDPFYAAAWRISSPGVRLAAAYHQNRIRHR